MIPRNTSVIVRRIPTARAANVIETEVKAIRGDEVASTNIVQQAFEEQESEEAEEPQAADFDQQEEEDVEGAISSMLQTASTWT